MAGSWLSGSAWLDEDGRHVWFRHDCDIGYVTTMLPWPTWHSDGAEWRPKVSPSVACGACGFHAFVELTARPDGYGVADQPEQDA